MKTKAILFSMLAFPALFFACKKDAGKKIYPITEKEAVEVVSKAITRESGGLVLQMDAATLLSLNNAVSSKCGLKVDTVIRETGGSNGETYSYNLNWSWVLTCSGNVPSSYSHTFTGSSSYKTATFSSSDQSSGTFTVAGMAPTSTNLIVSNTYVRNGTQKSSTNAQDSFTSKITITTTDVKVSKATGIVLSGVGIAKITGLALTGEPFSYDAKITFTGNNKALLVVVGGSTYQLSW